MTSPLASALHVEGRPVLAWRMWNRGSRVLPRRSSQLLVASRGEGRGGVIYFRHDCFYFLASVASQAPLQLFVVVIAVVVVVVVGPPPGGKRRRLAIPVPWGSRRQLQYFTAPSVCVVVPRRAAFWGSGAECSGVRQSPVVSPVTE